MINSVILQSTLLLTFWNSWHFSGNNDWTTNYKESKLKKTCFWMNNYKLLGLIVFEIKCFEQFVYSYLFKHFLNTQIKHHSIHVRISTTKNNLVNLMMKITLSYSWNSRINAIYMNCHFLFQSLQLAITLEYGIVINYLNERFMLRK